MRDETGVCRGGYKMSEVPSDPHLTPPKRLRLNRYPLADPTHRADFTSTEMPTYEQKLASDPRWALSEGSMHFREESEVFQALHKISQRLKDLDIPYAVVGGMALFQHGLRRFTEDVDIL